MNTAPWLELTADPDAAMAWRDRRRISRAEFACSAATVAAGLPDDRFFINRCGSRYNFAVAFAAVALRDATNLLPPAAGNGAIESLRCSYPNAPVLDDALLCKLMRGRARTPARRDLCSASHIVAIAFTSGSSGVPRACPKPWQLLAMSAHYCRRQVGTGSLFNVVATVPSQHMFGLETVVVTAIAAGWAIYDGPSFLPAEIVAALEDLPRPRMLITSPLHLGHILSWQQDMPGIDVVLTATAPLSQEMAREAERRCGGQVQEIYGCSEAGSLATRRTANEIQFSPYPGVTIAMHGELTVVSAEHFPASVQLADQLEFTGDGKFILLGRDADMVKVAGRRGSLTEITSVLKSLPGVDDAVVFMPGENDQERPVALVVAPGRTEMQLRAALAGLIDPIFIPRPLRLVPVLPRNSLGKIAKSDLRALLVATRD